MNQVGEFIWDGHFWRVNLNFPDWQGYTLHQTMDYPADYPSKGLSLYLDSGDLKHPPTAGHLEQLNWIQTRQADIQNEMLKALLKQYPDFKAEALEWGDEEDESKLAVMLPEIQTIEALKQLLFPRSLMLIRESETLSKPLFAIEVDCSWDEQGLGVLMHGGKVLEVAEKDIIFDSYELDAQVQDLLAVD